MSDFISWLEDIQLEIIASSKTSQITIPEKDNAKPEAANNEETAANDEHSGKVSLVEATFNVSRGDSGQGNEAAESSEGFEMEIQISGSDSDEAEPSSMVDSALSGGSTKTSAPLFCGDHFTLRCAQASCLGCPRPTCSYSLNGEEKILSEESTSTTTPHIYSCEPLEELKLENKILKEETFEQFLKTLVGEHLQTPTELFEDIAYSAIVEESLDYDEAPERSGRKSAEDGKNAAFGMPFMAALDIICQPCNHLCPLSGFCTKNISATTIHDIRNKYFLPDGTPAPKDKERAIIILDYLRKARKDNDNNLIFTVDKKEVCTTAFLRLLGVTSSVDMTKTPGQWQRLIKGFLAPPDDDEDDDEGNYLLSETDIKKDVVNEFTEKRGHAKAFINDIAAYFSDTIPAVTTEDGCTKTMVVPYRQIKDLFREYEFHCDASGVGKEKRASYQTFVRATNSLRDDKVIKFLGGKSGFQTCSICNNTLAIKKSACCKRDTVTRDALLKISRLHLSQQACERQFAENFSLECEKIEDGQPTKAHIDFDGQSTWAGNTPVFTRDRTSKADSVIENRNIGVRLVCGPIKEYISVCTNNLIPHGANVVVEVLKYSIEYLARRLKEHNMVLPKKIGVQGDNSGENKNKEMFCFLSHLVEDCYFDEIELFFLIVGHTHNILDQWFGTLMQAIRCASFIGSVLALHELYKIAHHEDEAHLRPTVVHQLELYHDWRRFYNPVRNTEIHHFGIPHRFKINLDPQLKVAKMEYMFMSPLHGFRHMEKWQPVTTPLDVQRGKTDGDIPLSPLVIFNGPEAVYQALGADGNFNVTGLATGTQKERDKVSDLNIVLPVLRQIEVRAIGESAVRLNQEADRGISDETIHLSLANLKLIDDEISRNNSSKGGRIVWLRRSRLCDDPGYLDRRPDILPNPKLWRDRIAQAPRPPEETLEGSDAPTASSSSIPRPKPNSAEALTNKTLSADAAESSTRLLNFQKGAAEMALTASHMLKMVEINNSVLSIATHNNIIVATRTFQKSVLTPREIAWYSSIETAKKIGARTEALVAAEVAKPWALLNLPIETSEQRAHREAQVKARATRIAAVEANLRKLAMREGEGEYNPDLQVVSFDGFTAAQTRDVDKMIRSQLEALAKGHIKGADVRKMKVDQLRAEVKKLVEKFPNLLQIPDTRAASQDTVPPIVASPTADSSEVSIAQTACTVAAANIEGDHCSVMECDSANPLAVVHCDECSLYFCSDLHASHSSHSKQMLHPDRVLTTKRPAEDQEDSILDDESHLRPTSDKEFGLVDEGIVSDPADEKADDSLHENTIIDDGNNIDTALTEEGTSIQSRLQKKGQKRVHSIQDDILPETIAALSVPLRSDYDNPMKRQNWEVDKLKDAVHFVRSLSNEDMESRKVALFNKFNYASCYDIMFFKALADAFDVDLSLALSKKRPLHKEVLISLIDMLILCF